MKIILPEVRLEEVGYSYTYPGRDRIYYADDRPNQYSVTESKRSPIVEPRLSYRTAFDYDFKVAQRAAGVARFALLGISVPVAYALAAIQMGAQALADGVDRLGYSLGDLTRAAGIRVGYSWRSTFGRLIQEIVNP